MVQELAPLKLRHLQAIDGIRFLCALYVVLGHISPPLTLLPAELQIFITLAIGDGGWAVMIFFVISGLCIHLPYCSGQAFNTSQFLLARFCRIGLPLFCAWILSFTLHANLDKILWSLYCEIAFYLLYPLLRLLFKRYGILRVLILSLAPALMTGFLQDSNHGNFFFFEGDLAPIKTAILGLPIWLLGCLLAQNIAHESEERLPNVMLMRFGVIFFGLCLPILSVLNEVSSDFPNFFLFKVKYSFLLCSPFIYWWLYTEISQKQVLWLFKVLKPFGLGAYSIYLMHVLSTPVFEASPIRLSAFENWLAIMGITLIISTLFYFLIEKPSHLLGRRFIRMHRLRLSN